MIRFKANERKVLEVILWLATALPGIDKYRLLKVLFLADKQHLNSYGRPIAGEQYVAMKYGPVPETAYKILRQQKAIRLRLGVPSYPFDIAPSEDGRTVHVYAGRAPDLRVFSPSEIGSDRRLSIGPGPGR